MRKLCNTVRHAPDEGLWGDCFRVCIAMVLHLDPEKVPHFFDGGLGGEAAFAALRPWARDRGLSVALLPLELSSSNHKSLALQSALDWSGSQLPDTPVIIMGQSGNRHLNCGHCVVALGGELHHDPTGSGIGGPDPDGFIWVLTFAVADRHHGERV